ncbi:MAG: sodium:solute symporter family protein [Cyclobacteriaceae bacterium]|nr:sodium:solute symporter family protein [Cyclobacteriaceae bacterium]
MHLIDIVIFVVYMLLMLGIGYYFLYRNTSTEDYYVGGRSMGSWHVGLSVVATDVGGGFSIGLGGLGFVMGLSGTWMLFTGLLGAWISAVVLIPRVHKMSSLSNLLTFPQIFKEIFNARVALLAAIISAIGYMGFTSSQILAGAKLAAATFDGLNMQTALVIMGLVAVVYTVMGGIKAVIYTDTVQWIILMGGLIFIGIPLGYFAIGGMEGIRAEVPDRFLRFDNLSWQTFVNWGITIIPIWFTGMTLYQRIYSCRSAQQARKAWFIAGLFEWPVMAFMGVLLGLFAKVAWEQGILNGAVEGLTEIDPEMGLPLFLKTILPAGLTGLMLAAYFSAIMSTADSCLMAASGNVVTDLLERISYFAAKNPLRLSQISTLIIGMLAVILAAFMENVLELMLMSYAFMVSGLFIPVLAAFFDKKKSAAAAFWGMLTGGCTTLSLIVLDLSLPLGLDPNFYGIITSLMVYLIISRWPAKKFKSIV